jgi:hypothetical protein
MGLSSIPSSSRRTAASRAAEDDDEDDGWGDVEEDEDEDDGRLTPAGRPFPPRVPWEELGPDFLDAWGRPRGVWMPEHMEILGPNGSGKSFFEREVLLARARLRGSHIVILATKPADRTLSEMGWPVVTSWPPNQWNSKEQAQVIYWAKADGLGKEAVARQRQKVEDLLDGLWHPESNTVIAFDEIAYVAQELGLATHITTYYREARALGITIIGNTQRPQGVPRAMHSESTWAVCFAPKDEDDAERVAQALGDKKHYVAVLMDLDREKREFLLTHNLTREAYISHIPAPAKPVRNSNANEKEPGTGRKAPAVS